MTKTCSKCLVEKNISEFYFRKDNNTYRSKCKECIIADRKNYYECNKETLLEYGKQWKQDNSDYVKLHSKKYYQSNKPTILEKSKNYNILHKYEKQEYDKNYYSNNKDEIIAYNVAYIKTRKEKDTSFKLRLNVSRLITIMIRSKNGSKCGKSIIDFLPYSIKELKEHLEKQFEPWMNWQNWGKYSSKTWDDNNVATWTWQLDHIIPQSDLPYSFMTDDNFRLCWSLDNLRPLNSKQNLLDGTNKTRHK